MSEILSRFSLEAAKFNGQIFACLVLIWVALVTCAIVSINSQSFSGRRRWIWIWIVVGIPLFGLLAYLPFSVRREDLPLARAAALTVGLDYCEVVAVGMFLERDDPNPRHAVHLIWAGEKVHL